MDATVEALPAAADGNPMAALIEDMDRGLSDIQQSCQGGASSDEAQVEQRLHRLRQLLEGRRAQGLASPIRDLTVLRAELRDISDRLSSEMQVLRLLSRAVGVH